MSRVFGCFVFALCAGTAFRAAGASAATSLKTLHQFNCQTTCTDGSSPQAGLLRDSSGDLYGTTYYGGANINGVVFRVAAGGGYQVIHTFCTDSTTCPEGASPQGGLIEDINGNLYGTAQGGGAHFGGTVFELIPNAARTKWKAVALYSFCSMTNCNDGLRPVGRLTYAGQQTGEPYDGTSPLYGVTNGGGAGALQEGVVFQLNAVTGKTKRKEKVIYTFCPTNCDDGGQPVGGMIMDASGNLYGTSGWGAHGEGVVFELSPRRRGYRETVLYTFCSLPSCADGGDPQGALVQDAQGNLIGTGVIGGANDEGVLFRIAPKGTRSREKVLYSFCPNSGNCADGAWPGGDLVLDASGNIFGSTQIGGAHADGVMTGGTVFEFSGATEQALYSFCAKAGCTDGNGPVGGVIADSSGNLYGVTRQGGDAQFGDGTAFELQR